MGLPPLDNLTLVLLTPARAKPKTKTLIKIIAPEDSKFGSGTNAENVTVQDTSKDPPEITWTATLIRGKNRSLKYLIEVKDRQDSDRELPDAGTITVTLPTPPPGVNDVVSLHVDYVDLVDGT